MPTAQNLRRHSPLDLQHCLYNTESECFLKLCALGVSLPHLHLGPKMRPFLKYAGKRGQNYNHPVQLKILQAKLIKASQHILALRFLNLK